MVGLILIKGLKTGWAYKEAHPTKKSSGKEKDNERENLSIYLSYGFAVYLNIFSSIGGPL